MSTLPQYSSTFKHSLVFLFILSLINFSFAGAPQKQAPTGDEYDLVILNPSNGKQQIFRLNDYIRLSYYQYPDDPVKSRTIRLQGNLEAVNDHSINIDGTWIPIKSVTRITRPSLNGAQMTEKRMNLNVLLVLLFPLLFIFSVIIMFSFFYNYYSSEPEKQAKEFLGGLVGMIGWGSFLMIPFSFLMQPGIKWRVNKNRILMAKKRGA